MESWPVRDERGVKAVVDPVLDDCPRAEPVAVQAPGTQAPQRPCPDGDPGQGGTYAPPSGGTQEDEGHRLHAEVVQLRRAMETRPVIDQALGVLMATFSLSPQRAWNVLVTTSQNTNIKVNVLARDLVGTFQGAARLSSPVRKQLAIAVARSKATSV